MAAADIGNDSLVAYNRVTKLCKCVTLFKVLIR